MAWSFVNRRIGAFVSLLRQFHTDPGERHSVFWVGCVNGLLSSPFLARRARSVLYRAFGLDISYRALVSSNVFFRDSQVAIGPGTTINYGCIFDNRAGVQIGKNVGVGIGVVFLNSDHNIEDPSRRAGTGRWASVKVCDGAYIGSGSILLPGVEVSSGVVVAAGSVVTKNCAPNGLYAGTPARRIRELKA